MSRLIKKEFIEQYEDDKKYADALKVLDDGYEDAIQFFSEPKEAYKHIRSTNVLERINAEDRRREKVIRVFPKQQSAIRLISAVLMDIDKDCDPGSKREI